MESTRNLYGGEAGEDVSTLLEQAMQSYEDTEHAERLLWQAHRTAPETLPVYFSMYKFYFYKGDLENAGLAAHMALVAAAGLGGFDPDWRSLDAGSADWAEYEGPAHFYLFSLKALAFINLRLGKAEEAHAILDKLTELDPADSVGASVIRSIAEAAE